MSFIEFKTKMLNKVYVIDGPLSAIRVNPFSFKSEMIFLGFLCNFLINLCFYEVPILQLINQKTVNFECWL